MITSKATYTRPISKIFIDTFKDLECKETVNFPTRLENSTKRPTIVDECSGFPGLSDCDTIKIDIDPAVTLAQYAL